MINGREFDLNWLFLSSLFLFFLFSEKLHVTLHSTHHPTTDKKHEKAENCKNIRGHPFAEAICNAQVRNGDCEKHSNEEPEVKHDFIVPVHMNDLYKSTQSSEKSSFPTGCKISPFTLPASKKCEVLIPLPLPITPLPSFLMVTNFSVYTVLSF
ncbi:MAG: hypothetical protein ACI837_003413 [Crocinitomicaceae bacterium]|jgi:hypothetical protein